MTANETHVLIQRAEAAMFQAELADAEIRETLFIEAKDALIQVEMTTPGRGAWLMACLSARTGSTSLARKWLERAHTAKTLPERSVIVASTYMKGLHGEIWFQEIVEQID